MRLNKIIVVLLFLTGMGAGVHAQVESVPIKSKKAVFIPKLDVFWSAVIIADSFPTFFPLELEVNLPGPRLSINAIVSPWSQKSSSQIATTTSFTTIGGLGLRYYFRKRSSLATSATGFFVEPQFFFRYEKSKTQVIGGALTEMSSTETGLFLAGGYQHAFFDLLYIQGRLSVGFPTVDFLDSWGAGDKVTILPWVGVGIRLN